MKTLDWILAVILVVMGVMHSALTPLFHRPLTVSAVWFLGSGLALVFGGMINILRVKGPASGLLRGFSVAANGLLLLLVALFVMVAGIARNAHEWLVVAAVAGEFAFSLGRRR